MKTTQQWLAEIKADPNKLIEWLKRQYVGEALAADRIQKLADIADESDRPLITKIANDELTHTQWVQSLLEVRNIPLPEISYDGTRYWKPILENLNSFDEIAGAGHHAETMRLIRIRALSEDLEIDSDIRQVFTNILPDEEMHAKAFLALSTPEAIESTRLLHNAGLALLGLEI